MYSMYLDTVSTVRPDIQPFLGSTPQGWHPSTARKCTSNRDRATHRMGIALGAVFLYGKRSTVIRDAVQRKLQPNGDQALDALRKWRQKQPEVEELPAPSRVPNLKTWRGNRWRRSEKNVPSCVATWHGWMKSMDSKSFFQTVTERPDLLPQYLDAAKEEGMAGPGNEVCLQTADFMETRLALMQRSAEVVDLGCGDAALASELLQRHWKAKVTSVDAARLAPGVVVQNLGSLPDAWTDRYQVAVLCRALWSLDYLQVLGEAHRVLQKDRDARLIVVEPFRRWWGRGQDAEEPENQLLKALERAGFHLLLEESENYAMPNVPEEYGKSNLLPVMVHETVLQHGIEVMHSPMVTDAVSFISAAPAMRALRETGHSIAHWLGDHFQPQLGDSGAKVLPTADAEVKAPLVQERADDSEAWGGGRMVEFFAQSCPHCKHLEPIWKDASHKWAEQGQDSVRWEQKECYGENWAEGKDHDECMKEGIHSFPTVRFFSKSGKKFADFSDERTPENLVGFAARHGAKPERIAPLEETREEHSLGLTDPSSPVKVVEYVAKSCPHCQSMEPIWNDLKAATASKKNILWEQKECFGKGWAPGKDLEECKKADIQGFPTIKFFGSQGGPGEEFSGARSVSSILKWVEQHTQPAPEVLQEVAAKTVQAAAGPLWAAALCTPVLDRRSKADFL